MLLFVSQKNASERKWAPTLASATRVCSAVTIKISRAKKATGATFKKRVSKLTFPFLRMAPKSFRALRSPDFQAARLRHAPSNGITFLVCNVSNFFVAFSCPTPSLSFLLCFYSFLPSQLWCNTDFLLLSNYFTYQRLLIYSCYLYIHSLRFSYTLYNHITSNTNTLSHFLFFLFFSFRASQPLIIHTRNLHSHQLLLLLLAPFLHSTPFIEI